MDLRSRSMLLAHKVTEWLDLDAFLFGESTQCQTIVAVEKVMAGHTARAHTLEGVVEAV